MKKSAFTLIESLIVLFIVGIVTLIGYHQYGNVRKELIESSFIRQFETEFLETQKWAIIYGLNTSIGYERDLFRFYQGAQRTREILKVPPEVSVNKADTRLIFMRNSGRSSLLAAYVFQLHYRKEIITYQIQMGSAKYVKTVQKIKE